MNLHRGGFFSALLVLVGVIVSACANTSTSIAASEIQVGSKVEKKMSYPSVTVAGGCFWCIEAMLEQLDAVVEVESGYAGGASATTSYQEVSGGATGHAEVCKVLYDPKKISAHDLLSIFMVAHDPTTLNRQGGDVGTQYRSAIFYSNPEEKLLAEQVIAEVAKAKVFSNKIVTTVEPLKNYIRAEEYHQDYFRKYEKASPEEQAKMNAGYCAAVVSPKAQKFRQKFIDKIKKG